MTIDEFLDEFHDFLILTGGAAAEEFSNITSKDKPTGSAFFKPYESTANFFIRASSVVTAPISLTILSLELLVVIMIAIPKSITDACMGKTESAIECIVMSGVLLLGALTAMLIAIVSPLINLIDLIGSGCVSVAKACQDEEKTAAGYVSI